MTAGRADSLLQAAGLKETVLGSLERGDSLFVLTDDTLLFQDSGGIRRVTLRDLRRIHSDESGLLRVETPAGTALTSSLLGFDPAAVQSFFRQVKEATAKAKERAGSTTIITEPAPVPRQAAAAPATPAPVSPAPVSPAPGSPALSTPPATPAPAATWTQPANPTAVPPRTAAVSASPAPSAPATPSPAFKPAGAVMAQPTTPPPATPRPAAAPLGTPAVTTPVNQPPVNPMQATPPAAAPAASRPVAPAVSTAAPEAPKATVKAVRTPTVITDPAVTGPDDKFTASPARSNLDGSGEKVSEKSASTLTPVPAERPVARPALPGGAAGALAALAAVAGSVGAWGGRLKFLSVVMLLAALALAYLQFDKGLGLSGVWVLIAGGMSAVALWALGDITKLLVSLAQAVSAEGGVMDVD